MGLWAAPKTQQGRLSNDFKVIWCEGDLPKLATLSAKTSNCLDGETLGLRFNAKDYATAFQAIFPGQEVPLTATGDKVFRVDGLPFWSHPSYGEDLAGKITMAMLSSSSIRSARMALEKFHRPTARHPHVQHVRCPCP